MSKHILLVDDDETLRKLFRLALSHKGHTVDEAETGAEALEKLDHGHFDLIVIDVMMPVLDGLRLLAILREERRIETPVLVLTSMNRAGAESDIRAAGANDVALKPISHTDLLARVETLLSQDTG